MTHDHSHSANASSAALGRALVFNGVFLVIEAAVGFATGSLALLSDALHMLSDVGALGLALFAARIALRPATPGRSFGFVRAEILGAFVNAILLGVACVLIVREAVERLAGESLPVAGLPVLVTGVIGLVINLGCAWQLKKTGGENLNVKAALAHVLADAMGSVGAVIAAVVMLTTGMSSADAVASLFTALLIVWGVWKLLGDSLRVLLQFAPKHVDVPEIERRLLAVNGVQSVHELHVWSLNGVEVTMSAHLVAVDSDSASEVRLNAERMLVDAFKIEHTTLQVEAGAACTQDGCPALRATAVEHNHGEHGHAH